MAGIQRKIPHVETTNARSEMLLFMKHWAPKELYRGRRHEQQGSLRFLSQGANLCSAVDYEKEIARRNIPDGPFLSQ
jgi:hypothetical protein